MQKLRARLNSEFRLLGASTNILALAPIAAMMTVRLQPPSSPAHPSPAHGLYIRSCQHERDRLCDADGISRPATWVINTGSESWQLM
jgi:hypothetical protein